MTDLKLVPIYIPKEGLSRGTLTLIALLQTYEALHMSDCGFGQIISMFRAKLLLATTAEFSLITLWFCYPRTLGFPILIGRY